MRRPSATTAPVVADPERPREPVVREGAEPTEPRGVGERRVGTLEHEHQVHVGRRARRAARLGADERHREEAGVVGFVGPRDDPGEPGLDIVHPPVLLPPRDVRGGDARGPARARRSLHRLGRARHRDRWSDLDLAVCVDEGGPGFVDVLARLGEPRFWDLRTPTFATGFVGPDWRRIDLTLLCRTGLAPDPACAGARIVKDTDGVLASLVAASRAETPAADADAVRSAIAEAIDSQVDLALHNARGAVWSATGEATFRAAELYTLLARLRRRESHGFRYVETLLTAEEQALLSAAWPSAPGRDEVRRAARDLWRWTRHVQREAERVLGAPLGVEIDEDGLLAAVDRIYT